MKHAPYAPPSPSQVADSGEQEQRRSCLAPQVGFEPTTGRLTAKVHRCSRYSGDAEGVHRKVVK